jgi:glutamyl-tRNA reductase
MSLLVIGLSHKTAPIDIRERLSFAASKMDDILRSAQSSCDLPEVAILSTCNRTEVYATHASFQKIQQWWADRAGLDISTLDDYLYVYEDRAAVEHLMKVASGLDSLILGEPQIFGQIKEAYAVAQANQTVSKGMSKWFEQTFSVVKNIRTQTGIGREPVSVAYAAICLARQIFADIEKLRIAIVGAGQTAELVAEHLKGIGAHKIVVINRTLERAERLAGAFGGRAESWEALEATLADSDIVVTSTASQAPVIEHEMMLRVVKKRRYKPLLAIDLAMPRDIEPTVREIDEIFLYTIDELEGIIEENREKRAQCVHEAEKIIHHASAEFMSWYRTHAALAVVVKYRSQVEQIRQASLTDAMRVLQQGESPEAALQWLANDLTNKWMHKPTVHLKDAILNEDSATIDAICQIFEIDP